MELGNNVVVGGGKLGAKLWDWTHQYPKGAIVLQTGLSLELLPPEVSKGGDLPAAQPGSIQIVAFRCWFGARGSRLPESCWDGMPTGYSVQLPLVLLGHGLL